MQYRKYKTVDKEIVFEGDSCEVDKMSEIWENEEYDDSSSTCKIIEIIYGSST